MFDSVDASLEIRSCRVGVSDHGAHITDDGGKINTPTKKSVTTKKYSEFLTEAVFLRWW